MLFGGLQKCTLVDVPGKVAATVFTIGCPFRCSYCHNPELVIPSQFATPVPHNDVIDFLKQRIGKLGALCITGGEPTVHKGLGDFIKEVKDLGYFVKLDTNGIFPDKLEALFKQGNIDYIAMDVKCPLEKYELITKKKNMERSIQRSIDIIMNSGIDYEFRTTIAKPLLEVNDFESIGKLIKGAKKFYLQNYVEPPKQVDTQIDLRSFTKDELIDAQSIMKKYVKDSFIR
jgi:pyruvate formate lyase activating enzyme